MLLERAVPADECVTRRFLRHRTEVLLSCRGWLPDDHDVRLLP